MCNLPKLKICNRARMRRFAIALSISLILGVVFALHSKSTGKQGMIARGDFPPFYAAARIVESKMGARLYDKQLLAKIEQEAWPDLGDDYLAFAYPPYTAFVLQPLAKLTPQRAKVLFSVCMSISALCAVLIVLGLIKGSNGYRFPLTVFLLSFPPVLVGCLGGQNTGFSMLLFALFATGILSSGFRGDLLSGVTAGIWLFKPQFGILCGCLLLLFGRFKAFTVFVACAALCFYLGAMVTGWEWPLVWFKAVVNFSKLDTQVNGHQMVSVPDILGIMLDRFFPSLSALKIPVQLAASGILGLHFLNVIMKLKSRIDSGNPGLWERKVLALVFPLAVISFPHMLFYELGLAILAALLLIKIRADAQVAVLFLGWGYLWIESLLRSSERISGFFVAGLLLYLILSRVSLGHGEGDKKK